MAGKAQIVETVAQSHLDVNVKPWQWAKQQQYTSLDQVCSLVIPKAEICNLMLKATHYILQHMLTVKMPVAAYD